jgi:hypothetical protein
MQSTYDQLMKLQMKDLDINTYNATFKCLTNIADGRLMQRGQSCAIEGVSMKMFIARS